MGYRALELVIQSAQGLRNVHNAPQLRKMNPFALVSIRDNNNNLHSSVEQTPIDSEGNTNPKWNFHVTFNIDITKVKEKHLALVVKLRSRRITGDRDVGEVRVVITELEGFGDAKAVAERHVSKTVVNLNGTSQQEEGKLKFSYKFGNTVQNPPASTVNTASTVNIGNSATPNVQRRPGTARRLVGKFIDELGTAVADVAATEAVNMVLSHFNPFASDQSSDANQSCVDPSVAESSAAYPSGVDPSSTESVAADPSDVDPPGADPDGTETDATDTTGSDNEEDC